VLDQAGSEMGFFCALILACIFILLNQVDGKFLRLKLFLMNRSFYLIEDERLINFVNWNLRVLVWISYSLPFLTLGVWAAGLILRAKDYGITPLGGISVILIGFALLLFAYAVMNIKWNSYAFGYLSGACFFFSLVCITIYQFLVVMYDNSSVSFFGYSTVFLNANLLIMIFNLFINNGITNGSIYDIINSKMLKGEGLDPERETGFDEEISLQRENKLFQPTLADIIDLYTIAKIDRDGQLNGDTFGNGF
jgi:hypothetical protein